MHMKSVEIEYNEDSILVLFDRTIETMEGNRYHDELEFPVKIARLFFKEVNEFTKDKVDLKRIGRGFKFTYKGVKCKAV